MHTCFLHRSSEKKNRKLIDIYNKDGNKDLSGLELSLAMDGFQVADMNKDSKLSKEELNREGTTYTVETLSHLTVKHPGYEYYFIMGADSLYHIESWKDPEKILEMATIVVAGRAGTGTSLSSQIEYIENKYDATIYRLNSPVLEISSNDIRRRVRDGESIRYLLPSKVVDYIYGHNLYQPDPPEEVQKENE